MTLTKTPCLTAAGAMARHKPVVFTYVTDPIAAGVGTTFTSHIPHLTGVGSFPPIADTLALIKELVPGVKTVGTVYNSSEANSRKVMSVARELFPKGGVKLEEATVTSTAEILQAVQGVATRNIQVLWISGDNTAMQGFDVIARTAHDLKLPLIVDDPEYVGRGALASVGVGWYEPGHEAGKLAARVLKGESPKDIPLRISHRRSWR